MTIELVPLCTATVSLAETIMVSPSMVIGEVTGMTVQGDRLNASMKGHAAADWLRLSPEGFGIVDVRATLETDDGAVIFAHYTGRLHLASMIVHVAPQFHTGDERYTWINAIQAVAKGTFEDERTLVYEMYEVV